MLVDFMGRVLFKTSYSSVKGQNEINLPLDGINVNQCLVRVTNGTETFTKILKIKR